MPTVLVTGGAGYIGSHTCKAFARAGWSVVVYDDLSRGWRDLVRWGPLIEGSVLDSGKLDGVLAQYRPDVVAHFAAVAYVGESVLDPWHYYRVNTTGTLTLLEAMRRSGTDRLIFSSTCATYGLPSRQPIDEQHGQQPINPYGWSKFTVERMIEDHVRATNAKAVILRYFNAAGADIEGEIGERHEPETHAIPLAILAALGGDRFTVFGADFETRDGTAIRDYVHVGDLADAHVLAAGLIDSSEGVTIFNLGTEHGMSVREILTAVEAATGRKVPAHYGPRRAGDPPVLIASAALARERLGWRPVLSDPHTIIETATRWHRGSVVGR